MHYQTPVVVSKCAEEVQLKADNLPLAASETMQFYIRLKGNWHNPGPL